MTGKRKGIAAEDEPRDEAPPNKRKQSARTGEVKQRHTTIYDAVARRISAEGFLAPVSSQQNRIVDYTVENRQLNPFEALMKTARGARGEQLPDSDPRKTKSLEELEDMYEWTRHLPDELELPEGELLEAIHAYASDFYGAQGDGMEVMAGNMDGTALLALGILLEEVAREQLGENGDLALLEGEEESETLGTRWFNGVRTVPFHVNPEKGAAKKDLKRRQTQEDFTLVKGSLLRELLPLAGASRPTNDD
jgi:hypothetical protein